MQLTGTQLTKIVEYLRKKQGMKVGEIMDELGIVKSNFYHFQRYGDTLLPAEISNKVQSTFNLSTEEIENIVSGESFSGEEVKKLNEKIKTLEEDNRKLLDTLKLVSESLQRSEERADEIQKRLSN